MRHSPWCNEILDVDADHGRADVVLSRFAVASHQKADGKLYIWLVETQSIIRIEQNIQRGQLDALPACEWRQNWESSLHALWVPKRKRTSGR